MQSVHETARSARNLHMSLLSASPKLAPPGIKEVFGCGVCSCLTAVTLGGCETGGGSSVDFGGTLTGRLQWGHSTRSRALLSSTEIVCVHQGQAKWIAIPSIQSYCTVRRKAFKG